MNELQTTNTRTIEVVAAEIRALTTTMLSDVIEIGRRLQEAKEMLPPGAFGDWVRENTYYSVPTANSFMRLFREYGDRQVSLFGGGGRAVESLSYRKALALLAIPSDEREEFIEAPHTVDGEEKTVAEMSTSELEAVIRERDDALAARAALEAEAADTRKALEERSAELDKAAEIVSQMEVELKELREQPPQVETVPDEQAVEKAREEGRAAAEKAAKERLDKAARSLDSTTAELVKVTKDRDRAQKALAAAEAKLAQAEKDEKRSALIADKSTAQFELLFTQVQETVNQLHGILLIQKGKDAEQAQKLSRALVALGDKIKEVAEI